MRILTKKGYKHFEVGPLGEGCADGCIVSVGVERFKYSVLIGLLAAPLTDHGVCSGGRFVYVFA